MTHRRCSARAAPWGWRETWPRRRRRGTPCSRTRAGPRKPVGPPPKPPAALRRPRAPAPPPLTRTSQQPSWFVSEYAVLESEAGNTCSRRVWNAGRAAPLRWDEASSCWEGVEKTKKLLVTWQNWFRFSTLKGKRPMCGSTGWVKVLGSGEKMNPGDAT